MAATRSVLLATGNRHKVAEIGLVLGDCGYRVETVEAPKIELQSNSLETIASTAAALAYHATGKPVAVEDAGLFIKALNGFPGPYSSYVYKTIGLKGILKLMASEDNREALFRSVIAYAGPWGIVVFEGEVRGIIAMEARGSQGFGFDPIFIPEGSTRTFAEMKIEEKNKYSHRAKAARKLCEWLRENSRLLAPGS
ncbi:MAG: non-canonical purine NTP pyrophosphatase, RdgB/HAM1 family [Hyperthermus sp.]|nr:MAG: non-canonical purine NTP pyrophosphatase, RdgB/HAM1 family [Hyperthermus sp.]